MTPQVLTLPDLPFEGATSTSLSANEKQSVPYWRRSGGGEETVCPLL